MDEEIERAMRVALARIKPVVQPDEAVKFSQAALNLAHLRNVLAGNAPERKSKAVN